MKKAYHKPEISFESFQLTTSIANECTTFKANSGESSICEYTENGFNIFVSANNDCNTPNYDCYHVMSAGVGSVFGS